MCTISDLRTTVIHASNSSFEFRNYTVIQGDINAEKYSTTRILLIATRFRMNFVRTISVFVSAISSSNVISSVGT